MGFHIKVQPDVKIYVEDLNPQGEKTILFLHGWPASHKMFEYQFDQLPKRGFRCVGMDTRGFGNSDKPFRGYDYNTLADDIRCVVEAMGLSDVTLAGHSTGGAVAIRYMARHHGYGVGKLALCAAAAPSLVRLPCFPHGQTREAIVKIIRDTRDDRPAMLRGFGDIFFFRHVSQAFSDWFFQLGLQAAGWATAAVAAAWLNEEMFCDMGQINVPTLILHGIHDQVCEFSLALAQHKGIRDSRLVPFKYRGPGHFYDEREKFTDQLAQFAAE